MRIHSKIIAVASIWATAAAVPALAQEATPGLIPNADFQVDTKGEGRPDGWPAAKGPLTYEVEDGNRFARLTSQEPGKTAMLYRLVPIPQGVRALELSWKQRITDLKPGKQAWFDARIMMEWKDAEGKKLKGAPSAPYARRNTDGWVQRSTKFLVPEGATHLEFMPALFQVQSGVFDLDDIVLTPTDPEPLEAAARERAAAKAAKQ